MPTSKLLLPDDGLKDEKKVYIVILRFVLKMKTNGMEIELEEMILKNCRMRKNWR